MDTDLDYQSKIAEVRNLVISHPEFERAYRTIYAAIRLNQKLGISQNLVCAGSSGTGKSTLKVKLEQEFPRLEKEEKMVIPVLVVDTPALPTVKNLAEEVLISLGDPQFRKGSAIEKTNRILNFFKACEVNLVIFDELQHFIDQGRKSNTLQVSDWLKTLIDKAEVSTVLMGLERSDQILRINEQLRRRFSKRINIRPFDLNHKESRNSFIGVISKIDQALDLPERMDLLDQELLISIHFATNGIIDYIVKLLTGAYEIVILESGQGITRNTLQKSFSENIWMNGEEHLNPFSKKFCWSQLDKPGMPFHSIEDFSIKGR